MTCGSVLADVRGSLAALGASVQRHSISVRRYPAAYVDLTIHVGGLGWREVDLTVLCDRLAGSQLVESVQSRRGRITLRLSDDTIVAIVDKANAGSLDDVPDTSNRRVRRILLDFCDPNLTKALHVGHFRNIAIGMAIRESQLRLGATVSQQMVVADMGRAMSEALAAYEALGGGLTPQEAGQRGDVFIGRLYARYVAQLESVMAPTARGDAPIQRELENRYDLAQTIWADWANGSAPRRQLWSNVVSWVREGQSSTLARLAVGSCQEVLESSTISGLPWVIEEGLRAGILEQEATGAVVYRTGRSDYGTLPLVRADGLPTEHLRGLEIWRHVFSEHSYHSCIHVMGSEWETATVVREELLSRLGIETSMEYRRVAHGMVLVDGSPMKSSEGSALLIDDLLDRIVESSPMQALHREHGGADIEALARLVASVYLLSKAAGFDIQFQWESVLSQTTNPGWDIARSLCLVPRGSSTRTDLTPSLRFLVLQRERLRHLIAGVGDETKTPELIRFLATISRWYLDEQEPEHLNPLMASVLKGGLAGLGIVI